MGSNRQSQSFYLGNPQVKRKHYFSNHYLSEDRFLGLHAQLTLGLELPDDFTLLEVGPGPGMFAALLNHFGRRIYTTDFASDIFPDIISRLPFLPFINHAFDVVFAFEILEHLPFPLLQPCLNELKRISRKKLFISLPSQQEISIGELSIKVVIKKRVLQKTLFRSRLKRLTNPLEHYWEIGHNGISHQTIIDIAKDEGLIPLTDYFIHPWFHFFVFDT